MRFIALAYVLFLSFNQAQAKTVEEHWTDVGLSFGELTLDNQSCNKSEQEFIACVHALNTALAFETERQELVPSSRLKSETGFGAEIQTFDPMSIVKSKTLESDSFAVLFKHAKDEKKLANDALIALYKDRASKPVDFEAIYKHVTGLKVVADKEAYAVGMMLNAMTAVQNDPHTYFVPSAYFKEENTKGAKDITGIGAMLKTIKKNGKDVFVVQQPMEGGPAFKSGLRANDIIAKIDGSDLDGLDLTKVVDKIRGPKGSEVKLTIQRGEEIIEFSILRDLIKRDNVEKKMLSGGEVGYLKLSDFMTSNAAGEPLVYSELKDGLTEVLSKAPKSLVLDLRDNGGGQLGEAVRVASLFLKKNSLVLSTKDLKSSNVNNFRTSDAPETELPLVLMINSRSASASEIVAGALQDYQRAFLVGERSFGKATVQQVMMLPSLPSLLLAFTIQRFYQPSGRTNQVSGILPDLEVFTNPNPTEDDKVTFREEDEYLALPPAGPAWKQPREGTVKKLADCVSKGGAEKEYVAHETDAIPPDYQLLVAADAAKCVVSENLWAASEPAPSFADMKGPTSAASFLQKIVPMILP